MVGIFAEGRGDLAVITNILKGTLQIDRSDIRYALPEFEKDQTDLSVMPTEQQSSWTVVKSVCEERHKIDEFFNSPIEEERFIVIHLDTAERHLKGYDVIEPKKSGDLNIKDYCGQLRTNVVNKIDEWLKNEYKGQIAYAVAIEETDAWVLTLYDKSNSDTATYNNPKERLKIQLLKQKDKHILGAKAFTKYDSLSSDFRKTKKLLLCTEKNESLKLFCESLEAFRPAQGVEKES